MRKNLYEDVQIEKSEYVIPVAVGGELRYEMPQISEKIKDQFLAYLMDEKNIQHRGITISPAQLYPTQKEFNNSKIKNLIRNAKNDWDKFTANPILISSDFYILDGHHRWVAAYNFDKDCHIPVILINSPIDKLLDVAKSWDGVVFKTIKEMNGPKAFRSFLK